MVVEQYRDRCRVEKHGECSDADLASRNQADRTAQLNDHGDGQKHGNHRQVPGAHILQALLSAASNCQSALRVVAGFCGRHSRSEVLLGAHLDVREQLVVEVLLETLDLRKPLRRESKDMVFRSFCLTKLIERHGVNSALYRIPNRLPVTSSALEYRGDRLRQARPILFFFGKLLSPSRGQPIIAGAPSVLRRFATRR